MATADTTVPTGTPTLAREVQVRAKFQVAGAESGRPVAREALEEAAIQVVEAVESHASSVALGPAVACDFDDDAIELEFTVEALRASEVHQRIGVVLAVIERYTPMVIQRVSEAEAASAETAPA